MYQLCHFTLFGDFAIHDVTTSLSLEPSSTIEKGELIDFCSKKIASGIASWDLYGPDSMNIDEQAEFLIATLWERKEAVRKLAEHFSAHLCVALTEEAHTLTLKPEALRKLEDMKVALTCDRVSEEAKDGD